jgi:ABC-2 type transport system ATP-binding protein
MSELQDTADHMIVVGRGRVLADTSMRTLLASVACSRVTLRTSATGLAAAELARAGGTVTAAGGGALTIDGLQPEQIVALLAGAGVPFAEVSAHRASLEEAYLELTREAVEYHGALAEEVSR